MKVEDAERVYAQGYWDGIKAFAVWRNGVETVGSPEQPIKNYESIERMREMWNYNPPIE